MLFKFCQIIVAFLISVSSLFTVTVPTPVIETEKPLVSVNPNPIAEEKSAQDVKVMTFNLKYNGDGYQTRENRFPKAVKIIEKHSPDSFGVQEAEKWWTDSFEETLTQYARVGTFRDDGISLGESSSVFYLKDKYELVDSGNFWLSETPDKPGKGWDAVCIRIASYVKLTDKETGKSYVHFNTHLDHIGEIARIEGVKMIQQKAASFGGVPVVCTGDFNVYQDSDCYNTMISGNMSDARKLAPDTDDCYTFHGFRPEEIREIIDFVFVDEATVKPVNFKVINKMIDGEYYSDHFAAYADIELI